MLYNIELKQTQNFIQCLSCPYKDAKTGQCNGLNKKCFEYDEKTQTIIDGITKLPLKLDK